MIIVGAGTLARNTAQDLLRRSIPFIQVVAPGALPPLDDQPVVNGNVGDDETLRKAGVADARMVIAANDDDGENTFVALAAKDIRADVPVLAGVSNQRALWRLKLARADMVFAPAEVGSCLVADLMEGGRLPAQFDDLSRGGESGAAPGRT